MALMGSDLSLAERQRIIKDLKTYCGQDTLAMVKILERLRARLQK
jgi:hypothetical protein